MTGPHEPQAAGDPLREALVSQLRPEIMARLQEVAQRSGLSIREILSEAIDFAWHVEMSGELDPPYNGSDTQPVTVPINNGAASSS